MTDINSSPEETDQPSSVEPQPAHQATAAPVNQNSSKDAIPSTQHDGADIDISLKKETSRAGAPCSSTGFANSNNLAEHAHSTYKQDAEQRLLKAKRDLESMVLKYAKSEQENLQNKMRVDELDKKLRRAIKDNDQLANRIKLLTNDKNQLTDSLSSKVAQLTVLEQKNTYLNSIQGVKLKEYEEKIRRLEASNEELQKQVDDYKCKQTELVDFSERLSMKHMMLQTELDEALQKTSSYREQHESSLKERDAAIQQREELSEQIDSLSESLTNEQELTDSLRKALDEADQRHQASVDEHHNEIKIMRRKHQMATRELVKELKQLQVRLGGLSASESRKEEPLQMTS